MEYYWQIIAATIAVIVVSVGVPFILSEVFPWQLLYKQRNAKLAPPSKSFKGKTVMITGANGAYGSRAARIIADLDVDTLVLVDVKDCAVVKAQIEAETKATKKPKILVWQVDMMSFESCAAFAKKARELKSLDSVLLTAGILSFKRVESPEGWETSIQVNYLSTALIALLLLPVLKPSASNPQPPTMTFVTTFGIYPSSPFLGRPKTGSYLAKCSNNSDGVMQAHQYGISKGLLLYFARELASRVEATGGAVRVTVNSTDPGSAWTPLTAPNQGSLIPRLIMNYSARDPMICAGVLVNGVSAGEYSHGKVLVDYDLGSYPPFMDRKSGRLAQKQVWRETREVFEKAVPEVGAVYRMLDNEGE